ncbi:hypothetical protein RND71_015650 [Anisodus tanguticus]|uniref:Uncharacterized protein n=1 Tax=Anisodus tanguticus TaxID=243964 RepID=A0AAE1S7H9_9SOLA|nr:hypothetical protein RND71_015650 [Anisodus tanguticus]
MREVKKRRKLFRLKAAKGLERAKPQAYANWDVRDPAEICVRGVVVPFTNEAICKFVEAHIDVPSDIFKEMCHRPPYRHLGYTLCGPHPNARSEQKKKQQYS